MFRFTIRDVLWLTVVVALGVGWWINRRQFVAANEALRKESSELRLNNFEIAIELAAEKSTPKGEKRIRELYEAAMKSPLTGDEANEVLFEVRHGADFRTRVRAMAILRHLKERDEAVEALRSAIRERGESSAEGVVPLYAAKYLAVLKATSAIGDVRAWVDYLKGESPYDAEIQSTLLQNSETFLAELVQAADPQPAAPPSIVTKQRAIEIVRSLALDPGEQAEIKCEEFPEEYRVFLQFYALDDEGKRVYSPGGHAMYILDKSGSVLRTIRGL